VLIVAARRLVWKSEPDPEVAALVSGAVQRLRFGERAAALGLSPGQVTALVAPAPLPAHSLEAIDADQEARQAIALVSFIVLLTMIMVYGSAVADGVAQEKGTRVMELLVCRVRPRDLLAGKVLGIGLVGLGQMVLAPIAVSSVASWEIVLAAAVMVAATYGLVRLGGAVYSGALLRTGARPRIRDVRDAARAG
jgi:ABC-2 type transport system permease protein